MADRDAQAKFEKSALAALFNGLRESGINYAVLRNFETLPDSIGARDIDILVAREKLPAAGAVVLGIADAMGLRFANHYADERLCQFTLAGRLETGALVQIKIDFFTCSEAYGIELMSGAEMLSGTVDHQGIPVAAPHIRLLDKLMFHLAVGRPVHPKYDARFGEIARGDHAKLEAFLSRFLTAPEAKRLVHQIAEGSASKAAPLSRRARLKSLARLWAAQGPRALSRSLSFAGCRLRDRVAPHGLFLSLSGPDGSGKTTVIERVVAELGALYGDEAIHYAHFRPSLLPRIAELARAALAIESVDTDYARPHRAEPSGTLGSIARFGYYWLDYLAGYLGAIHPALVRREVVLFDRYVHDMICDPGRSRVALPAWFTRSAARLLPLPRWAFFIRVRPEEAYRRKQELALDVIRNLTARYEDLARRRMLIAVDNGGTPDAAATAIVDRIVADRDAQARSVLGKRSG